MLTKSLFKFVAAALAASTFLGTNLPAKAESPTWVRAQTPDYFTARGLVPPGYFSKAKSQKPVTVAVSKSGRGVGTQKPAAMKSKNK